ncbi:hypothetical protein ACFXA3_18920, partial [Streptomyces sp. NPDC059456]
GESVSHSPPRGGGARPAASPPPARRGGAAPRRPRLDCVSTNPRLLTYYRSAGYRVVGEFPHKEGKDGRVYGVILLEKRLDQLTVV